MEAVTNEAPLVRKGRRSHLSLLTTKCRLVQHAPKTKKDRSFQSVYREWKEEEPQSVAHYAFGYTS